MHDLWVGEAGELHLLNAVYEQWYCCTVSLLYFNRNQPLLEEVIRQIHFEHLRRESEHLRRESEKIAPIYVYFEEGRFPLP